MGAVYEAEHIGLEKRVAVKLLHQHLAADKECQARFVREGKAASRIRHPHIVEIFDVGETEAGAYLVMELLDGESMLTRLEREKQLGTRLLCEIMIPVAMALGEGHKHGIIHRDVKPENVFLTQHPAGRLHPKVLDFGVSKVNENAARITRTQAFVGTPYYASPEQVAGHRELGGHSDQYSLGVLLYEAATGSNPFSEHASLIGVLRAISEGEFKRPRETYTCIDSDLESIMLRAMALQPEARYPSMEALATDLFDLADVDTRTLWWRRLGNGRSSSQTTSQVLPHAVYERSEEDPHPRETASSGITSRLSSSAHHSSTRARPRSPALTSPQPTRQDEPVSHDEIQRAGPSRLPLFALVVAVVTTGLIVHRLYGAGAASDSPEDSPASETSQASDSLETASPLSSADSAEQHLPPQKQAPQGPEQQPSAPASTSLDKSPEPVPIVSPTTPGMPPARSGENTRSTERSLQPPAARQRRAAKRAGDEPRLHEEEPLQRAGETAPARGGAQNALPIAAQQDETGSSTRSTDDTRAAEDATPHAPHRPPAAPSQLLGSDNIDPWGSNSGRNRF